MPLFDVLLLIVLAGVAYWVAGEGFCGAAASLLAALFAGLAAMNFFEPLAELLEQRLPAGSRWAHAADVVALVGLFVAGIALFRTLGGRAVRDSVHAHPLIEELGRWTCGAATGYVAVAFLLTALHTAPLPREFLGFEPERKNLFGIAAPDRQWLGFTQYVSEHVFPTGIMVPDGRGGEVRAKRMFDGSPRVAPGGAIEYRSSFPMRYAHRRAVLEDGLPPDGPPAGDDEDQ
ncbi:MAG: CvpA family protein [Planctomycetales bacterium]